MKILRGLTLYALAAGLLAAGPIAWAFGQAWQLGVCIAWALWAASVHRLLADATHGKCRCRNRNR